MGVINVAPKTYTSEQERVGCILCILHLSPRILFLFHTLERIKTHPLRSRLKDLSFATQVSPSTISVINHRQACLRGAVLLPLLFHVSLELWRNI